MGLLFTSVKNETIHKSPENIFHEVKRAPTNDSIRLAKEYEEKIHSQIAEKLMVNNNLFTYSLAFSQGQLGHTHMYVKIKINGEEFSENFNLDSFSVVSPENVSEKLLTWLCGKILMQPINSILQLYYSNTMMNYSVVNNEFIESRN